MSAYRSINEVKVGLDFGHGMVPVGRLASRNGRIYFEYDAEFLRRGLELSPFKLPLESGVRSFDPNLFEGLPGLFNDSLPDGWGRLLLDRYMRSKQIARADISPLERLAYMPPASITTQARMPPNSFSKSYRIKCTGQRMATRRRRSSKHAPTRASHRWG